MKFSDYFNISNAPGYPNSLAWSEDGILAIVGGNTIDLTHPGDLQGPRSFIGLDRPASSSILDAAGAPKNIRHDLFYSIAYQKNALICSMDERNTLTARSVVWSPAGVSSGYASLLGVLTNDYHFTVYSKPPSMDCEWRPVSVLTESLVEYLENTSWKDLTNCDAADADYHHYTDVVSGVFNTTDDKHQHRQEQPKVAMEVEKQQAIAAVNEHNNDTLRLRGGGDEEILEELTPESEDIIPSGASPSPVIEAVAGLRVGVGGAGRSKDKVGKEVVPGRGVFPPSRAVSAGGGGRAVKNRKYDDYYVGEEEEEEDDEEEKDEEEDGGSGRGNNSKNNSIYNTATGGTLRRGRGRRKGRSKGGHSTISASQSPNKPGGAARGGQQGKEKEGQEEYHPPDNLTAEDLTPLYPGFIRKEAILYSLAAHFLKWRKDTNSLGLCPRYATTRQHLTGLDKDQFDHFVSDYWQVYKTEYIEELGYNIDAFWKKARLALINFWERSLNATRNPFELEGYESIVEKDRRMVPLSIVPLRGVGLETVEVEVKARKKAKIVDTAVGGDGMEENTGDDDNARGAVAATVAAAAAAKVKKRGPKPKLKPTYEYDIPQDFSFRNLPPVDFSCKTSARKSLGENASRRFIKLRLELQEKDPDAVPLYHGADRPNYKEADKQLIERVITEFCFAYPRLMRDLGMTKNRMRTMWMLELKKHWDRKENTYASDLVSTLNGKQGLFLPDVPAEQRHLDLTFAPANRLSAQLGDGVGGIMRRSATGRSTDVGKTGGGYKKRGGSVSLKKKQKKKPPVSGSDDDYNLDEEDDGDDDVDDDIDEFVDDNDGGGGGGGHNNSKGPNYRRPTGTNRRAPKPPSVYLAKNDYEKRLLSLMTTSAAWSPLVPASAVEKCAGGAGGGVERKEGKKLCSFVALGTKGGRIWIFRCMDGDHDDGTTTTTTSSSGEEKASSPIFELVGSVQMQVTWVNSLAWSLMKSSDDNDNNSSSSSSRSDSDSGTLVLVCGAADGSVVTWKAATSHLASLPDLFLPQSHGSGQKGVVMERWQQMIAPDMCAVTHVAVAPPCLINGNLGKKGDLLLVAVGKANGTIAVCTSHLNSRNKKAVNGRGGEPSSSSMPPAATGEVDVILKRLPGQSPSAITGLAWLPGQDNVLTVCNKEGALGCFKYVTNDITVPQGHSNTASTITTNAAVIGLSNPVNLLSSAEKRKINIVLHPNAVKGRLKIQERGGIGGYGVAASPHGLYVCMIRRAFHPSSTFTKQLQVHQKLILGLVKMFKVAGTGASLTREEALEACVRNEVHNRGSEIRPPWDVALLLAEEQQYAGCSGTHGGGQEEVGTLVVDDDDDDDKDNITINGTTSTTIQKEDSIEHFLSQLEHPVVTKFQAHQAIAMQTAMQAGTGTATTTTMPGLVPGGGGGGKRDEEEEDYFLHNISTADWRRLQLATALRHLTGNPPLISPSATDAQKIVNQESLERNEMLLLQRHIGSVLNSALSPSSSASASCEPSLTALLAADWVTLNAPHPLLLSELIRPACQVYQRAGIHNPPTQPPSREECPGLLSPGSCAITGYGTAAAIAAVDPTNHRIIPRCAATLRVCTDPNVWVCRVCRLKYLIPPRLEKSEDGRGLPVCLIEGTVLGPSLSRVLLTPPCTGLVT